MAKTLIFIPTYIERDNAPRICAEIHERGLDADVLFVDDSSPDGTGEVLESLKRVYPRLIVHHRPTRRGVGSAHLEAINWAYDNGYETVVTMDCDFTHAPADIPALISAANECDVAVGSRWLRRDSLSGWNLFRRFMTAGGRFLTKRVLRIPQDASGAFRCYRLDRLPREVFNAAKSAGYPFFYETLFILNRNGFSIKEVPIVLSARTYGHSKMSTSTALSSAIRVLGLWLTNLRQPEQFLIARKRPRLNPELMDFQDWDAYWAGRNSKLYDLIAGLYRRLIIKRNLEHAVKSVFKPGSTLLHAGCGGGQVDRDLQHLMKLTGLDISLGALDLYSRNNPSAVAIEHGSIFSLPFADGSFDGVYNLGVMEHFTPGEIAKILREFHRVLRPDGKAVIFWPHQRGLSVFVLKAAHIVLNRFMKRRTRLHPHEITYVSSRAHAEELVRNSGFDLVDYRFGFHDCFVQATIVASKRALDH